MKRATLWITIIIAAIFGGIAGFFVCHNSHSLPAEIKRNPEKYGIKYWRDDVAFVGDGMFQIMDFGDNALVINTSADTSETILGLGLSYCFDNGGNLFFYSEYGYAVVYALSNICKVARTVDPVIPEDDELKQIIYLDYFDEFTEYEQKMLNKLKEDYQRSKNVGDVISEALSFGN